MNLDNRGTRERPRAYHMCRRDSRHVCTVPFTLQRYLRFGPVVTRGMVLDIGMRGMSALVCGAPRVGETVVIDLPLRGEAVELLATVRHSNDAKSGFEFFPLSPMAQQGIQDWIDELQRGKETLFRRILASAAMLGGD